ncbi:ankyrin repeat domain-containing protein [Wolbachia endosymbiont (group B) of Pammene fasciana]|uniref:ankyrin repeat domain-containing protein n=2 Tax=unclassified Wolbachia TaxID=2640676 RepID=UPI00223161E5|nr:ankyrin repeat domain-containing protein [Wolbachia endosymbiont (group B) of Pammene fasciana]
MFKNKFDTVISVFKAKSSTSAKTLSSGLFVAGNVVMARAISEIDLSSLQGNSEDKVNKQDLIIIYDYINKVTQEENYNICTNNLDCIKSRILAENISDSLAEKFRQDGWNIISNDGSSLLTVAIERIRKEQKKNRNYDIHVEIAVSLILSMGRELIIKLENFADSNDKTLLHYLAESGKEDILCFVIENSNFDIKEAVRNKDRDGKTPLHYAAKSGNKECLKILIENETDFSCTTNNKTELHYAARSGSPNLLEYLKEILTAKGIFDREKIKTDKYGNNALHYAVQSGNAECIKFFIDNQVQFLKNKYNENPFHKIVGNSETQENAINFLIEHLKFLGRLKSEINQENVDGNTPLHIAAKHGNNQLMKLFTQSGAKIVQNKQGNTPLHIAIIHGNSYCIDLFYENIGNSILQSKGDYGRDLVHLAAMYGKYDCLTSLLKKFPDYDLSTETHKGNMALHLALSSNTETELRKKCVSLLIDRSMQVNKSNNEGNTPLHFAAQLDLSFLSMIEKKLEEKKFDVYQEVLRENSNGDTVFHMAARVGNKSCLEHLFKKERVGEILSKKNKDGQTLLHLSILSGRVECVKYLVKKSPKGIFLEQNTQKKLLFAAILSGNKECLEFVSKELVGKKVAASIKVLYDENDNTPLHMAALANDIEFSQYVIESIAKSTIRNTVPLFNTNSQGLIPLHLAAMSLNAELIEYFMKDNHYPYNKKMLNVVSKSGRTALHYLVMSDNDFEKTINEDFKQGQFLKKLVLEKRKQNEHLREKAIKALFYLTISTGEKTLNEKINFDIKDNAKKTALDYAFKHGDTNILRLFLDFFYEIRENKKRKYDKLNMEDQERSKKLLDYYNLAMSISSVIISVCIKYNNAESEKEEIPTWISIAFSSISFLLILYNLVIGLQKEPVKRKIENYTEKMNRIEEATGKLAKTKVGDHDLEEYNSILELLIKNAEDISRLENELYKFTHETRLESKDKLNISPQKMSRGGSALLCSNKSLEGRKSSPVLNDLTAKLSLCSRRNSRVQNTMDKLDNPSCVITINENSEIKPKAPKNKFKNVATKLKIGNIFSKKKEDLIASSSLSEGANHENITKMNEENCGLIKRFGDTNGYSIFSTPFNPSSSTSREECGNNHSAARHVSYGSANNPVSDKEVSKSPSLILSNFEEGITVDCFKFERYRPRVYSSPSCVRKRAITARSLEYVILPDHIERGK